MGRQKEKWFNEKKIIGAYSDASLKREDIQNHDSTLGTLTRKVFQKNVLYHQHKVFDRNQILQKKP